MGMLSVIKTIKVLPKVILKNGKKIAFLTKKASPQLLVIGGVATATGAFVWAVINARKLNQALTETQEKVELIEAKRAEINDNDKPSIREWEKELNKAKAQSIWRIFYLVGLPAICFAGGMVMVCGGHLILFRRFGALSSAFAALQSKYNRYRQLNIAEHGEECDRRYLYGVNEGGETIAKITDENGVVTETKAYIPPNPNEGCGMYTFVFSEETSPVWNRDPIMNISFLKSQEGYWNARLDTGSVITLKDVLEGLSIELDPDDPKNDFIYIAGWRPNGEGDCRIDFGLNSEINKPTLDLRENYLVLNFNCDGNIYHSTRYTKNGKKISCEGNQIKIEDSKRGTIYDTQKRKYAVYTKR